MSPLLAGLALLAAADGPAVALMPLVPVEGATKAHAQGMDAELRAVMERFDFLELLPLRARDDKRANRCKGEIACLGELAHRRGAELLAVGQVAPADVGFTVRLQLVAPKGAAFVREVDAVVGGDGAKIARKLDLLARRAFAPDEVYAYVRITGSPRGAEVRLDGEKIGILPLPETEYRVVAGEHVVELSREGFDTLRRRVKPRFRETAEVHLELSPTLTKREDEGEPLPIGPVSLLAAGGGAVVLGAVAGLLSAFDAAEAERRASVQQLVFPRDQGLLARGQALAWTSTVLYVAGVGLAGGGAWWWSTLAEEDEG